MVSSVTSSAAFSTAMLSGSRDAGAQQADKSALQEKLFTTLDANGDGGIDSSELNDFISYATSSTGGTSDTSSAELFKSLDSDGDGSLSKTEMTDGAKSLFDALRTQLMSKSGEAGSKPPAKGSEDQQQLFAQIDTDGDGSINQDELGTFLDQTRSQSEGQRSVHGGNLFSQIESLLDQYRSTATGSTTTAVAASTLSIAA